MTATDIKNQPEMAKALGDATLKSSSLPVNPLPRENSVSDTSKRRTGKSMSRRAGQNGYIEKSGKWYVVRWRMDVEGQERRQNMRGKICPISGPGKLSACERERKAKEIVERSGANSEQHFNRVVLGEVTFREQAKAYTHWALTRDREPLKDASSIQAALNKWILPAIGDMPLGNVNNITVKPLVDKMKKSLSARTVNKYVEYVQQVVASPKNGETGEPIHVRKWDSGVMDLPIVNQKEQRRPALKAEGNYGTCTTKRRPRAGVVCSACRDRNENFGSTRS